MRTSRLGPALSLALLAVLGILVVGAPFFAPHLPNEQFTALLNAPPTRVHVRDVDGRWHLPFIWPQVRVSQLEHRYRDGDRRVPLVFLREGQLLQSRDPDAPLLLLGADSNGRDVFSRLLFGARTSIGVSLASALVALLIGATLGAYAGYRGHLIDDWLMRGSDLLLTLPAIYVALVLRALLPPVLSHADVFTLLTGLFAVMGWPIVARGVRGIVRTEREREYVVAARALGAGPWRVLAVHLIPATRGFLLSQLTLLIPAFVIAEATFSYVGLGFPDPSATWGTMLREAATARALADFPWLLSPAVVMFLLVLALHGTTRGAGRRPESTLSL